MHDDDTAAIAATYNTEHNHPSIAVVDGYGIEVRVTNRHLVLIDGIGPHRRRRRFHKATTKLKRLVVVGDSGLVTLASFRWLNDAGVSYTQPDRDGNVLATSASRGTDNPKLRRAQALAATNHIGTNITRRLLRRKISGQLDVATKLEAPGEILDQLTRHIEALEDTDTTGALMAIEGAAAGTYWQTWTELPMRFPKTQLNRIPDHWLTFGARTSPVTTSPRLAANPANAILNYLYAFLEAETTIGLAIAGLDPGIGILHADQLNGASLALDVMEAVRPDVDQYVVDLLRSHCFSAGDFHETRRGTSRLLPPLTHQLADTSDSWRRSLVPIVDELIRTLAETPGINVGRVATPFTQANRSRGRDETRRHTPTIPQAPKPTESLCIDCGATIKATKTRCQECNDAFQTARMAEARTEQWRQRKESGEDPSHGGRATIRRSETTRRHQAAITEWQPGDQSTDPAHYQTSIYPGLKESSAAAIAESLGVSTVYARQIRNGRKIPHPRHWATLTDLGGGEP